MVPDRRTNPRRRVMEEIGPAEPPAQVNDVEWGSMVTLAACCEGPQSLVMQNSLMELQLSNPFTLGSWMRRLLVGLGVLEAPMMMVG